MSIIQPREFVFYHAGRAATLKEGQEIILDDKGLSEFGRCYWKNISTKKPEELGENELREYFLEKIKQEERYILYASRMQSMFAANTIEEAILFGNSIIPRPNHAIPVIEIFATRFWNLDLNWMDYADESMRENDLRNYWDGRISNNCPTIGKRRPPRIEVMIALPAKAGKIVHIIGPNRIVD